MELYNEDCFNVFPKINEKSIDLFVLDLPYNQTACKWDSPIDLNQMWIDIKRIMNPSAIIVFFCTTKFGNALINSNPKWFRYDLVWEKSRKVGFLSANKMPLRQHEMIYIFCGAEVDDIDLIRNKELREYAQKVFDYIGKTRAIISKELGHNKAHHFYGHKSCQFELPIKKTYDELIENYAINEMPGFKTYEEMKDLEERSTYNPQKTEGKAYKSKEYIHKPDVYHKSEWIMAATKDTTHRHPTSILKFNNPVKSIHSTQKPTDLLEWIIKTYSNEGETVMDFTMGSGSTGEACKNTNRKFIGIEKDADIFNVARDRLLEN
jgi:site-specific DNA-methyltransferase (adenine-specific)